jgi:hypothetical protein
MKLAELERYFATVATATNGPPEDLERVFKSTARLSASELLAIYNRGYHYRLLGALGSVFARTKQALGDADFERLGLQYLARHPSEHPAIERVGRSFPDFLRGATSVGRVIVDLAALEWARLCALVAPNPSAIATASAIDPTKFPDSSLCFVPSLTTLAISAGALAAFARSDALAGGDLRAVAVWRKRDEVRHEVLDALEHEAVTLALSGASVSHVCALFDSGAADADAERAFRVVSGWFTREWITAHDEALRISG